MQYYASPVRKKKDIPSESHKAKHILVCLNQPYTPNTTKGLLVIGKYFSLKLFCVKGFHHSSLPRNPLVESQPVKALNAGIAVQTLLPSFSATRWTVTNPIFDTCLKLDFVALYCLVGLDCRIHVRYKALKRNNCFRFLVWDCLELACAESVKQTTGFTVYCRERCDVHGHGTADNLMDHFTTCARKIALTVSVFFRVKILQNEPAISSASAFFLRNALPTIPKRVTDVPPQPNSPPYTVPSKAIVVPVESRNVRSDAQRLCGELELRQPTDREAEHLSSAHTPSYGLTL
ncbi:hypothetical protein P5673_022876 [Acropora cervicornis]|uniref:Uncharacterized protein n=1 Tax=Acropora cervicornis TaxID=6130 RepID=A0AAD9Q724_ACRCE|nr:hypothetical protein P5673_022876 [Acropora cervicornis]